MVCTLQDLEELHLSRAFNAQEFQTTESRTFNLLWNYYSIYIQPSGFCLYDPASKWLKKQLERRREIISVAMKRLNKASEDANRLSIFLKRHSLLNYHMSSVGESVKFRSLHIHEQRIRFSGRITCTSILFSSNFSEQLSVLGSFCVSGELS